MARLLLIDDDTQFRSMLKQLLERNGYEVIEASDGQAGIDLFRKSNIDLVISDLIMPEKEGLETIQELKEEFPDVKIIAISGGGRSNPASILDTAAQFGAVQIFPKPVDREKLLGAIKDLLE